MKKNLMRVPLCLLAAVLAAVMAGGCSDAPAAGAKGSAASADTTAYTKEEPDAPAATEAELAGMVRVAEEPGLALYANVKTGALAVADKTTGTTWFSNPPRAADDPKATPYAQSQLLSQLTLQYHDARANEHEMNSQDDCVAREQLSYALIDGGIRFQYVFGEMEESMVIPRWISEERMQTYLEKMDADQQKFVRRQYSYHNLETARESEKSELLKQYPVLEKHALYALRENSEFRQQELMEIFAPLGYTRDDLNRDSEENGYVSNRTDPFFVIVVEYRLENGRLVADIPAQYIDYDKENFPLTDIALLPYFGSALTGSDGYLFVPDGSGALIRFDNGRTGAGAYSQPVYGVDTAFQQASALEADPRFSIRMPVYGVKNGSSAFLAVIEQGEALATIQADIAGKLHSYNYVYPSFRTLPYSRVAVGNVMSDANKLYMYAESGYTGRFTVRFSFLHGEAAGYMGMAAAYQELLTETGTLRPDKTETLPFVLELLGAATMEKKMLGVGYTSVQPLTTYAQAIRILDEAAAAGVRSPTVAYTGWYNGGLDGSFPKKVRPEGKLEKDLSLDAFIQELRDRGLTAYFGAELQYVAADRLGDGFSVGSWSPKAFDKKTVKLLDEGKILASGSKLKAYLVSPNRLSALAQTFAAAASERRLPGLSTGSLGYDVYSDFAEGRQLNRQQALEKAREAAKTLADASPLLGDNANAGVLGTLSGVVNAPLFSNRFGIIDEEVPFYQAVLHGCLPYTGEALNMAPDYREVLLKSVETGAGLHVQWMYESNEIFKNTAFQDLYAVEYSGWLADAAADYKRAAAVLDGVQDQPMTGHEQVASGVYRTTYGNGRQTLVNYNKTAVTVDGVTVAPRDFAAGKGA